MGDLVFLKVVHTKVVVRFGKDKLSARYTDLFEILNKMGEVANCLALLPNMAHV